MEGRKKKVSLGVSDFREVINDNLYFVDKSLFIKDVVDGVKVLLYPRPRRFGKTINLSMLKYFYDCTEDNTHLFNGLAISSEKDIMEKQGKYPVIFLTFKDVKPESYDDCLEKIFTAISKLYKEFHDILMSESICKEDKEFCEKIISKTASKTDYEETLKYLSEFLYKHYKKNPVILIDEYDTPIHAAYYHGYYDEIINFIRVFLGAGLKDNTYLEKGVLTGILRVSRESIFSDLNNITVHSMLSKFSADKFGFTDDEVKDLVTYYGSNLSFEEIKHNYDGYNFDGYDIYNPWSILNAVQNERIGTYWVNTSSNNLIKKMCAEADETVKHDLMIIIEGGKINKYIDEEIVFTEMNEDPNAIWNFLLMCGYLRYDNYTPSNDLVDTNAELSIPNKEILTLYVKKIIPMWFKPHYKTTELINLAEYIINGDIETFKKEFVEYCINSFSYYDVTGNHPEKFYHGFVLGIFTSLKDRYQIRSNRESGYGRYDIILIPNDKSKRGIVFEFKVLEHERGETFERAISSGKRQINEQKYCQELNAQGVNDIICLIAVFKGKEVRVESYLSN